MITLYGVPNTRSTRVAWTLEELGLDWQFHFVNLEKGEHKSPEYLAVNPCGKVPALNDDGLVLSESAAICHFLAEKYGDGKLMPAPATAESAQYHRLLSYVISELEQPLWTMGKHRFALPADKRIEAIFPTANWEFEKTAKQVSDWLGDNEFAVGEQFTVADILLCHTLIWAVHFGQILPDNLEAYRKRISQRPALAQAAAKEKAGKAAQS